jgi:GNAT superfamily N-acetyltransferase
MEPIVQKYTAQLTAILGPDFKFFNKAQIAQNLDWTEKLTVGQYELRTSEDNLVASFELYPMIHCCGICVSTSSQVRPNFRNRGLGTLLNSFRIDLARYLGYGCLLCTDIESNTYQRSILARNGWKDCHKFVNPRTQNTIFISVINL